MKKFFALLLAGLMGLSLVSFAAAEEAPIFTLEGIVTELTEDGFLLFTENYGAVEVLVNDDTVLDGLTEITIDRYVIVDYNGRMTRSIPGQVNAMRIVSFLMTGEITSIDEEGFLLNTEEYGDVYVYLPVKSEDAQPTPDKEDKSIKQELVLNVGDKVEVTYNGAMTMSLPGQINALRILPVVNEPAAE